ncbi:MAG: PEP-CTERM sorting domain-containing protein [Gemmatimonas sp.]
MSGFTRTLAALALLALPLTAQAQIATWNFNTLTDATILPGPIAPDAAQAGVTVGPLTLGPGLRHFLVRTYMGSPVLRFVNEAGANTKQEALERNIFAGFSLTPLMGHQLNLTTLTFDAWSANHSDPRTFFVRYSTDNFATFTELIGPTVAPDSDDPPTMAVGTIGLTGLTSTIEFRMYGYNHTGTDAADRALQYDNIVVNGTVTSVPEPGSLALLGLGLAGLGLRARRRKP